MAQQVEIQVEVVFVHGLEGVAPAEDRARTVTRAVERLWQVFGRLVPDWLGATMFRTFVEPALRDFARDVEDELFGLVERLAKAYGEAAIEARDLRERLGAMDRAWGLATRFQERHIAGLEARAVDDLHQRALDVEAITSLVQHMAALQQEKTIVRDQLDSTKDELSTALEAAASAREQERDRCVRDVCEACRQGRAVLRVEMHSLSDSTGHHVEPIWVHPDPETAPFAECAAGPIRERVRG